MARCCHPDDSLACSYVGKQPGPTHLPIPTQSRVAVAHAVLLAIAANTLLLQIILLLISVKRLQQHSQGHGLVGADTLISALCSEGMVFV